MILGALVGLALVSLEHVGRVKGLDLIRPSTLCFWLRDRAGEFFAFCGRWYARVGWIFEELYHSAQEIWLSVRILLSSLFGLLGSPWHFVRSYWETMAGYTWELTPLLTGLLWACLLTWPIVGVTRRLGQPRSWCAPPVKAEEPDVCVEDWMVVWFGLGIWKVVVWLVHVLICEATDHSAESKKRKKVSPRRTVASE